MGRTALLATIGSADPTPTEPVGYMIGLPVEPTSWGQLKSRYR